MRSVLISRCLISIVAACSCLIPSASLLGQSDPKGHEFFEKRIRPILVEHCYECHSESAKERQGGLLLDRKSAWLAGGDTGKAVVPGEPAASLLMTAVAYDKEDMQMPPEGKLAAEQIRLLQVWIARGAPGPKQDLGLTEFSRLGDQEYLFARAAEHWAFQPVKSSPPPEVANKVWNQHPIDRFVFARLASQSLTPSSPADPVVLLRRITHDLTGLPPTRERIESFVTAARDNRQAAIKALIGELLDGDAFGEHFARLWLDVARYADTDSFYRPDTRTPHYFPFAFTYRDYVVDAFNADKPFDQFVREQLAADLLGLSADAPELAALGFLTVGPHANRNQLESLDDWIDTTTRGLLGLTAACARCHDHKYEPIPTADYYAMRGVFASIVRIHPLDETKQPKIAGYQASEADRADFAKKRSVIEKKLAAAGGKKARNNNQPVGKKIRETELAQLLLFHPGGPVHAMAVNERPKPSAPFVFLRGNPGTRGDAVARRFLSVLDPAKTPFGDDTSGRLELAEKIVDPQNPLTARVMVNRVWGAIVGSHLVTTPSDFGLQGEPPTHPELLDWLAADFVEHGWSIKHLVEQIVLSETYRQSSQHRPAMAATDPLNQQLWRANRKHLSIEAIRDAMLAVSGNLDRTLRGRPGQLWGKSYTKRRTLYGYINRFNLDPTLRVFDFPAPMQSQPERVESIVAPQTLFTMNSPFVIDQAETVIASERFRGCDDDGERIEQIFSTILWRPPAEAEQERVKKFIAQQATFANGKRADSPWAMLAQALLMSNEFHYLD